jgi:mono/diheme cytochrome c family protein
MKMRALGSAEVQAKSDADLKKDIVAGNGKMKAVAISDAQATDVVAFIRTLKK